MLEHSFPEDLCVISQTAATFSPSWVSYSHPIERIFREYCFLNIEGNTFLFIDVLDFSYYHNKSPNTDSLVLNSRPSSLVDLRQASSQAAVGSNTKCIMVPFMSLQSTDTVAPKFSHATSSLRQLQLFSRRIYCAFKAKVDWLLRLQRLTSAESLNKFNQRQIISFLLLMPGILYVQVSTSVPVQSGQRVITTRFTPCGGEHLSLYVLSLSPVAESTAAWKSTQSSKK